MAAFADQATYRGGRGVGAGEVAVQRLGGVGEAEDARPLEDAWRLEPAGEEDELDVRAEVDDVEGEGGAAGLDLAGPRRAALLASRVLAAQVVRVALHELGLHSFRKASCK